MMKLIGACLILIATTWAGFKYAYHFRERPKQIKQLRDALSLLKTEIGYGTRPLIQACEHVAERIEGMVGEIFSKSAENLKKMDGASTYDCFQQAIEHIWSRTAMKKAEKSILLHFCQTLGRSDRQDQLQHMALAKANLEVEEGKAREEQVQYEKMCKTVGILGGVLLIILMY
jgi:stage III sporulation protein AB